MMTGIAKWGRVNRNRHQRRRVCSRYFIEVANNTHIRHRVSGPSNSETFQTETFKLSNSQTFELETRRTFELSISMRFKPSNFANFQSFELSNSRSFIPFKLSISETFKPSNSKPFEVWNLRTFKLVTSAPAEEEIWSEPFKLRTFKLSNFRTFKPSKLQTFKLSKFETVEPSNLQTFKLSNSQTSKADRTRPREKFEVWVWSSQSSSKVREFERLKVWKFGVWKVRSLTPASLCKPRCTNFRTPALSNLQTFKVWNFQTSTSKLSNFQTFEFERPRSGHHSKRDPQTLNPASLNPKNLKP